MAATLSDAQIEQALVHLAGWAREANALVKWYELPSFPEAIAFVDAVAEHAEAANHHPDIDIRYRRVRIALSTDDAGGITQKDIDLARQVEALAPSE